MSFILCYTTLQIEVAKQDWTTNKSFWNFIKQFLTNEGFKDKDITHIHRNKMIADEKQFT